MNKYCVVIGDNPELSKQVQEELFKAGIYWMTEDGDAEICGSIDNVGSHLLIIEDGLICCLGNLKGQGTHEYDTDGRAVFITAGNILNGGAMKLDGAKKVEPRWFLYNHDNEACLCNAMDDCSGWYRAPYASGSPHGWEIDELEDDEAMHEITAEDVAYIRDNADKAKEFGMELLKEHTEGDEYISISGAVQRSHFDDKFHDGQCDFCAGYRYSKKVESNKLIDVMIALDERKNKTTYCHNCAKPVTPAASNYCSKCGAKLEK